MTIILILLINWWAAREYGSDLRAMICSFACGVALAHAALPVQPPYRISASIAVAVAATIIFTVVIPRGEAT